MYRIYGLILTGIFNLIVCNSTAQNIHTEEGTVSGIKSPSGILSFKGIPFAAPPIGALRWRAPQPPGHWSGVRKCENFGPSPMQGKPSPFFVWTQEFLIPTEPINEDCLYLNIWTKATGNKKRPVLVWIYGGGFRSGGGNVPIYDGEALADKGVVFVSFNYRVGVFGFLAHPELTRESPQHASGNYGFLDQIAALQWIQKNISAFGGDPSQVTIAGQSAGSMSVNALVASPLSKGLFARAIAESGSIFMSEGGHSASLAEAETIGEKLAIEAGSPSLSDLRKMPAGELMRKMKGQFGPIVDGYVLPESVAQIFAENKQNNVPVITGWNADEGIVFTELKREAYIQSVKRQFPDQADSVLKYYPAGSDEEAANSQVQMSRDMIFALSGYKWGIIQSRRKLSPIYIYNFTRRPPAEGSFIKYKSFHTAEVPYALGDLKYLNRPLQSEDFTLSNIMSSYWVNFTATGDPNGPGLPNWPAFNIPSAQVIILGDQVKQSTLPDEVRLNFMLHLLDAKK